MLDVRGCLEELKNERPVFLSEADFQHALAWKVHEKNPSAKIILEYPVRESGKTKHMDIVVFLDGCRCAIELKFKTKEDEVTIYGEPFELSNQSAQDLGRYDFCKDIERVEKFGKGYAVLLTNDELYWKPGRTNTNDAPFRLNPERGAIHGRLKGSIKEREGEIILRGTYPLEWKPYSSDGFCYLLLEVQSEYL